MWRGERRSAMFGFMFDETYTQERGVPAPTCCDCHIRLASRGPRVVTGDETYHRDCYEAAHKKRTGKRPYLVASNRDHVTFRLPA